MIVESQPGAVVDRTENSPARSLRAYLPQIAGLLLVGYCAILALVGALRTDHVVGVLFVNALAWIGPRTRQVIRTLAGFLGVAWMYDAMRFAKSAGLASHDVLLCNLYEFERTWFGFQSAGQRITIHDWFFAHHHLAADLFFSVPYATFLFVTVAYAFYLLAVDRKGAARFGWAFFLLNAMGYITYHVVPAAPPWYFHAKGCLVDLAAHASPGPALMRVDAALGVQYFASFYGRATDVFGAIPSLHVAYPLMLVWEAFRRHGRAARVLALFYWLWMSMAAVYLDHHWITDVALGWAYALIALAAFYVLPERLRGGGAAK